MRAVELSTEPVDKTWYETLEKVFAVAADICGVLGSEKETGGGRESGSGAWRAYMCPATNTTNYASTLALAQNVSCL